MPRESVYDTEYGQAANDMAFGSIKWLQACVDAYESIRDRDYSPWWDVIDSMDDKGHLFDASRTFDMESLGRRLIEPPRVFSIKNSITSSLWKRYPKFFVEPWSAQNEDLAVWGEIALNVEWRRNYKHNRELRHGIFDAAKCGFGWYCTTYEDDYDVAAKARRKRQKAARDLKGDPAAVLAAVQGIPEFSGEVESLAPPSEPGFEGDDRVLKKWISMRRISPRRMLFDPDATCREDLKWVGHHSICDMRLVKEYPFFKNREKVTATGMMETGSELNPFLYVDVIQLFVKQSDGTWDLKVFPRGGDFFLREVEAPFDYGCPYDLLSWNESGDKIFVTSDIAQVYDYIIEEREIRTQLYDAKMREAIDFNVCDGEVVTAQDLRKIVDVPALGAVMRIEKSNGKPLDSLFTRLRKDAKTPDVMNYLAIVERGYEQALGLGPNQSMSAMKSGTTASEALVVEQRSQGYGAFRQAATEETTACVAHRILCAQAQFYDAERMMFIGGKEAAQLWKGREFPKNEIQAGISVTVEPGSMAPTSDEQRAAVYGEMIAEAVQSPIVAGMVNLPEAYLRRMRARGIHDGSKVINAGVTAGMVSKGAMAVGLMRGGSAGGGGPPAPSKANGPAARAQEDAGGTGV